MIFFRGLVGLTPEIQCGTQVNPGNLGGGGPRHLQTAQAHVGLVGSDHSGVASATKLPLGVTKLLVGFRLVGVVVVLD